MNVPIPSLAFIEPASILSRHDRIGKSQLEVLSFALIGILSVWTIATALPQANAATTSGTTDISKSIAEIVRNLQTLLTQSNNIATTTSTTQKTISDPQHGMPAIQAQLDDIQEQLGNPSSQSIVIDYQNSDTSGPYSILRPVEGKVYVGHMSFSQCGSAALDVYYRCNNGGGSTILGVKNINDELDLNVDFSCEEIDIYVDGGPNGLQLLGSVSYTLVDSTTVTELQPKT